MSLTFCPRTKGAPSSLKSSSLRSSMMSAVLMSGTLFVYFFNLSTNLHLYAKRHTHISASIRVLTISNIARQDERTYHVNLLLLRHHFSSEKHLFKSPCRNLAASTRCNTLKYPLHMQAFLCDLAKKNRFQAKKKMI